MLVKELMTQSDMFAGKTVAKTDVKTVAKTVAKTAGKTAGKTVAKTAGKTVAKTDVKTAGKMETINTEAEDVTIAIRAMMIQITDLAMTTVAETIRSRVMTVVGTGINKKIGSLNWHRLDMGAGANVPKEDEFMNIKKLFFSLSVLSLFLTCIPNAFAHRRYEEHDRRRDRRYSNVGQRSHQEKDRRHFDGCDREDNRDHRHKDGWRLGIILPVPIVIKIY